jgi:hemerythrin
MCYSWEPGLETGHEIIDTQHRLLIAAVDNIYKACRGGLGKTELINALDFLNCYIVKHFHEEEKIMVDRNYPAYESHRLYHRSFRVDIRDMTRLLMAESPGGLLVTGIPDRIADWLIGHIKRDDLRLAEYAASGRAVRRPF